MRIAMIADPSLPIPPKKYGGTERVIAALIDGLTERGHDVILLGPGDSEVPCPIIPTCEKHIGIGQTPEEQGEVKKQFEEISEKTKDILHTIKNDVDIIHSHGFDLLEFADVPNLTTMHGPMTFDRFDHYAQRQNLFYTTVSENQQYAYPDLNYVGVCYNGLHPEEFPFVEKPDDYVCFLGRFHEEKNPHLAIELALQLGIKIKLAAKLDYSGLEYFERKIKPYLDNPLVEYVGEVEFKEKIDLISHAKANLHPTGFREPFGITVIEAAYCGTPTLAIARGSLPEILQEGKAGYAVEDFLEGYHYMPHILNLDRANVAAHARDLFNYQTMTRQYERAYREVILRMYHKDTPATLKLRALQSQIID